VNGRPEPSEQIEIGTGTSTKVSVTRDYEANRHLILAAFRVVLGLPRVIPSSGPDDLLSEAS